MDPRMDRQMETFASRAGRPLAGVLSRREGPAPAVVVCHGMLSSMRSLKHAAVCAAFAGAGWHALRFDFTARGRSLALNAAWPPGRIRYGDQVEDLAGAVAWLRGEVEVTRLALVGSSMGGTTALLYAPEAADLETVVTFASPAFPADPRPGYGAEVLDRWRAEGVLDISGVAVESGYLDDAAGRDVPASAAASPARKLFLHGTEDTIVPPTAARALAAADPNGQAHLIPGADHRFTGQHDLLVNAALAFATTGTLAG